MGKKNKSKSVPLEVMSNLLSKLPSSLATFATKSYFRVNALKNIGLRGTHCISQVIQQDKMKVKILPALSDNYMYLIIDDATNEAGIVDPVEPETVLQAVKDENVNLTTVLTTHHHWDHAGGNKKLLEMNPGLHVVGGYDRIDEMKQKVTQGDEFKIGNLKVKCLATPCHTTGHICFYVTDIDGTSKAVFTGDTLFLGGCGRFFEGNGLQMNEALNVKLANLPNETKVYCGHEYSIQNLTFGLHVEPDNEEIKAKLEWCKVKRGEIPAQPTIPTTIGDEKQINPFMRVNQPEVRKLSHKDNDVDTMTFIRSLKDNFKPKK